MATKKATKKKTSTKRAATKKASRAKKVPVRKSTATKKATTQKQPRSRKGESRASRKNSSAATSSPAKTKNSQPTKHMTEARKQRVRDRFIEEFSKRANIREACEVLGIQRGTVYRWLEKDKHFKARFDHAREDAVDTLESEAWRRAHDGIDHPVIYQGEITDTYKIYSDTLLVRLLEANSSRYDRRKFEVGGPDGGPISVITTIERVIVDPKASSK